MFDSERFMNRYGLYKKVKIDFAIPGFDIKQQGLIINLQLVAVPSLQFRVKASGSIAKSLEKSGSFEFQVGKQAEFTLLKSNPPVIK